MNKVDNKTVSEVFQEIMLDFSQMEPTALDQLENKILDAIHKLGSHLMEWKLNEWNEQLHKEQCETCNGKLENRKRHRQMVTWVSDVDIDRYMSYCPACKKTEYPLDKVLGLRPLQRMSSQVEELATLCGASWKYAEVEYLMKKILRRYCVSHNTIQETTNQVGDIAFQETEGSKINQLAEDKLAQGDYFENMELWEQPKARIYMDMDGVMINSRDNAKRMEGKAAVVWSERELVKQDTYSLTDKRYMGSFTDTESFSWDVVSEAYKRSGGKLDDVQSLVRGDGAPFIRGFREKHMPKSRYILDYYHLCKKVKERLSVVFEAKEELKKERETLMKLLDSGNVDGALESIQVMTKRFRKKKKQEALTKLSGYIQRNREGIWYDEAREKGISIGAGSADKAGDILICRRMKLRGMRWSRKGANAVLSIRILIANREWDQFWAEHKAKLKAA